jgi:antitoxin VapB
MAINIKDPHTDRLARELAAVTGQPITAAVREAIEQRLEHLRRRESLGRGAELSGIIERGRRRRTLDERVEEEILGYGTDGLPS